MEYKKSFRSLEKCFQNLGDAICRYKKIYLNQCKNGKLDEKNLEKIVKLIKNHIKCSWHRSREICKLIFKLSMSKKIEILYHYCEKNNFDSFINFVESQKINIGNTSQDIEDYGSFYEIVEIRYSLMVISKFASSDFLDKFEKKYFGDIFEKNIGLSCHYYIGLIERGLHDRVNNNLPKTNPTNKMLVIVYISREMSTLNEYCNYDNTINYLFEKKMHDSIDIYLNIDKILTGRFVDRQSAMIFFRKIMNKCKLLESCNVNSDISASINKNINMKHHSSQGKKLIYYLIENNLHRLKGMNISQISIYEDTYNNKKLHFENILKKSIFPKELNNVLLKYIGIYDMIDNV